MTPQTFTTTDFLTTTDYKDWQDWLFDNGLRRIIRITKISLRTIRTAQGFNDHRLHRLQGFLLLSGMSLNHWWVLTTNLHWFARITIRKEKFVYILASLWWPLELVRFASKEASPYVAERVSIRGYGKRTRILLIYTNLPSWRKNLCTFVVHSWLQKNSENLFSLFSFLV